MVKRKLRLNTADIIIAVAILLLVIITIIPFMNLLALSFSSSKAILENKNMLFPKDFTAMAYKYILSSEAIYTSFFVTILVTVASTVFHIVVTILSGYVLAQKGLPLRRVMMLFVLITMVFSGGLIPSYLVNSALGLVDTFWVMTVPGAVSAYSIFLMKNFILQIPDGLQDAAQIDGAGPIRVLLHVVTPLSVPIIATLSLFCAVGKWNDWFTAVIYIKEERWLLPIQTILQNLVINPDTGSNTDINVGEFSAAFQSALIVVSMLPIVIAYPFVQKYFVQGMFIGSVKE